MTEALAAWGIDASAEVTRTSRGTNNLTFAVTGGGDRWVLRISQNLTYEQVRAEHRLLAMLSGALLPFRVPEPLPSRDGTTVLATGAGPASLFRWIPGVHPDLTGPAALTSFGRACGDLGAALAGLPLGVAPHDWRGTDPLRVHPAVPEISLLCAELDRAGVDRGLLAALRTAAGQVAERDPDLQGTLPVRVVHGDAAAGNTLVDGRTGTVTGLLDFEVAGAGFRIEDLAVALTQSGALDGPRWRDRCAALAAGYLAAEQVPPAELAVIPYLVLRRSLGSALWRSGRWRRGQAGLDQVGSALTSLATMLTWLETSGSTLTSVLADVTFQ